MNIMGFGKDKRRDSQKRGRVEIYSNPDDRRPVKWIPDGYNSWRVVYAD